MLHFKGNHLHHSGTYTSGPILFLSRSVFTVPTENSTSEAPIHSHRSLPSFILKPSNRLHKLIKLVTSTPVDIFLFHCQ
ncbi:hypothetical protein HanPI659440_Chr01g0018621 [Helianthus annuus]|nr:hypothetical protein HanPI659440_Chr01g0018621 [Helianthus annuus]